MVDFRREKGDDSDTMSEKSATEDRHGFVAASPITRKILSIAYRIAATDSTVLLMGESGTGKELIARFLHAHSQRRNAPFVAANCGAIPEGLLGSELFGHRRGAFTGATSDRAGMFHFASGGTILLDEVGEMPPDLQVQLLRVLQEREIRPVGSDQSVKVDVRIIAASNRDLASEVEKGRFREDLFYRLSVIPILLPPLRERREDIPVLATHFLKKFETQQGKKTGGFSMAAMELLMEHQWPGNVRELENTIERVVVLATAGNPILPSHLRLQDAGSAVTSSELLPLREARERFEEEYVRRVLSETDGNVSATAKILQVSRSTLNLKLRLWEQSRQENRLQKALMATETTMTIPAAFLCHSSADKPTAERLARDLRDGGVDVWFDQWEIAPGDSLRRKIDEGIEGAQFFFALISPESLQSEWVRTELDAAVVRRISGRSRLVPLLLNIADGEVPATLAATRWVRIGGDSYEVGLRELIGLCHGATEKPAVRSAPAWARERPLANSGLSLHAQRIAALLNKRCEKGIEAEFFVAIEDLQSELGLSDSDILVAISELQDDGIIKAPLMNANGKASLHGIHAIAPAAGLFFATDPDLRRWNPSEDAKDLAAALVNTENGSSDLDSLRQRLGWPTRRVNAAAYYLDAYGYAKGLRTHDQTFAFGFLMSTPRTLRYGAQSGRIDDVSSVLREAERTFKNRKHSPSAAAAMAEILRRYEADPFVSPADRSKAKDLVLNYEQDVAGDEISGSGAF